MTQAEVLQWIETTLIEADGEDGKLMGLAIIGDGINLMHKDERRWWRIEVRDITDLIEEAFRKPAAPGQG